jgi:hypothetical protein
MDPVDHTKINQLLLDFSRRSMRTDDIVLAKQYAQTRGYIASDETPTKFGSVLACYMGFNKELMDEIDYGT